MFQFNLFCFCLFDYRSKILFISLEKERKKERIVPILHRFVNFLIQLNIKKYEDSLISEITLRGCKSVENLRDTKSLGDSLLHIYKMDFRVTRTQA